MKFRKFCFALLVAVFAGFSALADNPAGNLRIELISGYNFVVRSNIESQPGTSPRSAYLGATFHNDGDTPLTNVVAYIGNYNDGVDSTPGIYPSRAHPPLVGPLPGGEFALVHEGGSGGLADATRHFSVNLAPGESVTVYWLVSYPDLDENGNAVHGPSVWPDDDLWLHFDVWGEAYGADTLYTDHVRREVHMRRMLQASSNKIEPNTANKVPQEYKDLLNQYDPVWTNTVLNQGIPGSIIVAEGYWFDLGNVNQGFDNDGDLIPDYNAWLQPVGDPSLMDPSSFRLVRTYVLLVIKRSGGQPDKVITAENKLYFTRPDIPEDNSGVVGYIAYEFMPLRQGATSLLSPYQAAASGKDNEKFNADYGATGGGSLTSGESSATLQKDVDKELAAPGETLSYTVVFSNDGEEPLGNPEQGVPLVIQDAIPEGTVYVAGSAAADNILPDSVTAYTIFYTTNSGVSWSRTEPATASDVTHLQWWLSDVLLPEAGGTVTFQVEVDDPFMVRPAWVHNVAGLSFGNTPPFLEDDALTLITGNNSLSGTVFVDDGQGGGIYGNAIQDGSEPGIADILLTLYYDVNGNGVLDAGDILITTTNSAAADGTYVFTDLPDGHYIVVVDHFDPDLPFGHTITGPVFLPADLDAAGVNPDPVTVTELDFGFAPVLALTKTGPASLYEGGTATYTIMVTNRFFGDGTGEAGTIEIVNTVYATNNVAALQPNPFDNPGNALGAPNGTHATKDYTLHDRELGLGGFTLAPNGSITNVKAVVMYDTTLHPDAWRANDSFFINIRTNANTAIAPIFSQEYLLSTLHAAGGIGTITNDITSLISWDASFFNPSNNKLYIQIVTDRHGGGRAGTLGIDAAGFMVTLSVPTVGGNDNNTLDPVPLTDFYDTNIFEFVSAVPPVTLADAGGPAPNEGRLYWDNVGPLPPGAWTNILVNFLVKEPPGNIATVTTNTAVITNATFQSGVPANQAEDEAVSEIRPTGAIGDFVWSDLNADGIQDPGEPGIAGVAVVLTPPAGVDVGNGPGQPVTNVTDASGWYLFTGLPSNGVYTVTVLTDTLPGGLGTNTYDEDDGTDNPNNETLVDLDVTATDGSDTHLTADFGYAGVASVIRGLVWHDVNRNGAATPDTGEPGLTGVTVYLYEGETQLAVTNTSSDGRYEFVGAFDGTYTVRVDTNSGAMAGGDWTASFDSDGLATLHEVEVIVPAGTTGTADFSYYQTGDYRIGDTIFYDWNGNGVQDEMDGGISNVTVRLYLDINANGVYDAGIDPLLAVDVTDSNGEYLFENLPAGDYIVIVDHSSPGMPSSFIITADPQGPMDGRSALTLTDADNLDQDFGYQPLGTGAIGDTVWRDRNADGIQFGAQETGISNVTVNLQVFSGGGYHAFSNTVTDADGKYLFSNLPDGQYRVWVDPDDPNLPVDTYGNPWYPTTPTEVYVTISGGNIYLDADFGFAPPGAIGDTIWWDANRNADQDDGEGGIEGVTMELYTNGVLVAMTVTDENGFYIFSGLMPATYTVVVVETGVLENAFMTAHPDNDGYPIGHPEALVSNNWTTVTLVPGQNFMGADFGYASPDGILGDLVWIDVNGNGQWDPGEDGIPFIPVKLYTNDTLVAETTTDANGYYIFYGLPDATYRVVVDTAHSNFPSGLTQTYDPDGTLDDQATNIVMSGGQVIRIGGVDYPEDASLDVDFGYQYAGVNVLSGTVGMDGDPIDGVLNGSNPSGVAADEIAFVGVTVYVYLWNDDGNGIVDSGETTFLSSILTDVNGDYSFTNLPPGGEDDYYIVALNPPYDNLYLTTTTNDTPAVVLKETVNSQGYTLSVYQAVPVAPETTNLDFAFITDIRYDFGDLPDSYSTLLASDGARHIVKEIPDLYLGQGVSTESDGQPSVWADADDFDDGVFVHGYYTWKNGAGGATVRIEVGAGSGWLVGFVDFDNSGAFDRANELVVNAPVAFDGGPWSNGVYEFTFDVPADVLSDTNSTLLYSRWRLFPEQPLFPSLAYRGEGSNGEVEDYRWGFHVINGAVFMDSDFDGDFSAGDTPQGGVVIGLYDTASNLIAITVTDADGAYGFTGVPGGDYHIKMTVPDGAVALTNAVGIEFGADVIALTLEDASVFDQDFLLDTGGSRAAIGGTVYDSLGFGVTGTNHFTPGLDDPVPGVTVRLYRDINGDGIPDPNEYVSSQVTDANGVYRFENLPEGDYIVIMKPPDGTVAVTDADGNDNGPALIEVALKDADIEDRDFLIDGTEAMVAIGNRVWFDDNKNGIQDAGETNGIAGVPVLLLRVEGSETNLVAETVTDSDGLYLFERQLSGTYLVRWDLRDITASNVRVTDPRQGDDDRVDSDGEYFQYEPYGLGGYVDSRTITLDSGEENMDVDLGLTYVTTTRAAVADVWGEWDHHQAWVVWQTLTEWGTAGFRVYRINPDTGAETLLQDEMIPSAFKPQGARYRIHDPLMSRGEIAQYRLEEIELSGDRLDLDTHTVTFDDTVPTIIAETAMMPPRRAAAVAVAADTSEAEVEPSDRLKVIVRQTGIHGIGFDALSRGLGMDSGDLTNRLAKGEIALSVQGVPVKRHIDTANARILFYGQATDAYYTREAVYMIEYGAARPMPRREPLAQTGQTVFPVSTRFEQDTYIFDTLGTPVADLYYWDYIVSGNARLGTRHFPIPCHGYAGGPVTLRIRLIGMSFTAGHPDHEAEIGVNGVVLRTVTFSGQEEHEFLIPVPDGIVNEGDNTLTVRGLRPSGTGSFFALDWIEAEYTRTPSPGHGTVIFGNDGASAISVDAFEQPVAMVVTDVDRPVLIADNEGTLPQHAWVVKHGVERFAVIESADIPLLAPEPATGDAWFMSVSNRIDYLIVVSRAMENAVQDLVDYRESQGLRVGVAVFEEVCDLMTHGLRTPEAIRDLVRHAAEHWAEAPWLVLLAGNGHYDYLGTLYAGSNPLPPLLAQTSRGIFAADGLFTDLTGNQRPDIAIGRLPARDGAELKIMIDKIKAHEAAYTDDWQAAWTLMADRGENGADFSRDSDRLAALAETNRTAPGIHRVYSDTLAVEEARAAVRERLDVGTGIMHYTGHGNPFIMGSTAQRALLRIQDVAEFENARRPLLVALSCLIGRFEAPGINSLGSMLMRRSDGGAVAVWSSSGLSQHKQAMRLGEAFYRVLLEEGVDTLGLAVLRARRTQTAAGVETFTTYNLLGDPALKLGGIPAGEPRARDDLGFARWRWEKFSPAELADPAISGNSADGFLEATIQLTGLRQTYNGMPCEVMATTQPSGLNLNITYDGSTVAPTAAGAYAVKATLDEPYYRGTTTGALEIVAPRGTIYRFR